MKGKGLVLSVVWLWFTFMTPSIIESSTTSGGRLALALCRSL